MLLLTNRAVDGRRLQQLMTAVEPCIVIGPGEGPLPSSSHGLIVCDAAVDDSTTLKAVQSLLALHRSDASVPLLYLSKAEGVEAVRQGAAIGATAVLHRESSREQILFTAKRMLQLHRPAASRLPSIHPAMRAGIDEVAMAFGRLFEVARREPTIAIVDLERGEEALISAVRHGHIDAWLELVRNYDDVTYQHCLSVAGLAAKLAIQLGLTLKGQRLVARSALVHDIGKARIPHAILVKAGPLTLPEAKLMRTHPRIGHDMLDRQGGFDLQVLDVVRHHHEYVDGTGYPDSLRGEQVKPLVRLVTICDVYAAMIERRPYKDPVPPRDALAALAAMGGRLDQALLASFVEMVSATP